jgi:hypothetical protein
MGEETGKEDLIEIKADAKMNELRVQALLNILAKEGIVSRKDFEEELESLCEEDK